MNDLVSVIMPCYNYARFLPDAIKSVINQTHSNWELIIVNDGSTDETEALLNDLTDPRIQHTTKKNEGVSAARNTGLGMATGEYIAFLDADDLWLPEKLSKQVQALEANSDCGIVFCDFERFDSANNKYLNFSHFCSNLFAMDEKSSLKTCSLKDIISHSEMPWYPTINLYRRQGITEPKFNPNLKIGEDVDFFLDIWIQTKSVSINDALAKLRVHGNNASADFKHHLPSLISIFKSKLATLDTTKKTLLNSSIGYYYELQGYKLKENNNQKDATKMYFRSLSYKGRTTKKALNLLKSLIFSFTSKPR